MPLYNFKCSSCDFKVRKIMYAVEVPLYASSPCPSCAGEIVRDVQAPTTQVQETLDNGIMPRKLERLVDVERLAKERSKFDPDKDR